MYKTKYFLLSLIFGLLITAPIKTFSQATTKVSGKVVDAQTREPLPFVNIIFKGTTVGVTTDVEGFYSMSTTLKVDDLKYVKLVIFLFLHSALF